MYLTAAKGTSRPFWTVFLLQGIVVVAVALIFFVWKYPNLPKATFYSLYREFMRRDAEFATRGQSSLEGEHFLIRYEDQDAAVAPMVLDYGEKIYKQVFARVPVELPDKALLLIVPDDATMNEAMGWGAGQSAMGVYYTGVIRILSPNQYLFADEPEGQAREFARKGPVAHELTHLMVDYRTKGNYTRWFTEGVAQYVEEEITGFRLSDPPPGWQEALYDFAAMDRNFDNLPDELQAYRQSLEMIEFLTHRFGEPILVTIMDELAKGYTEGQAIGRATGVGWKALIGEFERWVLERERDHGRPMGRLMEVG